MGCYWYQLVHGSCADRWIISREIIDENWIRYPLATSAKMADRVISIEILFFHCETWDDYTASTFLYRSSNILHDVESINASAEMLGFCYSFCATQCEVELIEWH